MSADLGTTYLGFDLASPLEQPLDDSPMPQVDAVEIADAHRSAAGGFGQ